MWEQDEAMGERLAPLPRASCSLLIGFQSSSIDLDRIRRIWSSGNSRCSDHNRSRVSRASAGSWLTRFISVSLNSECSLRFAEPIVSQASSMIPTLAWT